MFYFRRSNDIVIILIFVDDIIITGSSNTMLSDFIFRLTSQFFLKDLDGLSYFLSV